MSSARLSSPARLPAFQQAVLSDRWRAAFVVALVVVFGVSAYQHVRKVNQIARDGTQTKTAFLRWRNQIQELVDGQDAYRLHNYPNPPIQALILWPMTELPPVAGSLVWFGLKAGMAAATFGWVFRLCRDRGRPIPGWARALTIALGLHPVLGDLSHGNVNIFIAFLVVGALEAVRRGWDAAAGLTLALAIACKVTPALFLPYFGWKALTAGFAAARAGRPVLRDMAAGGGRVLAATAAGLAVWLLVVPGAALGWERNVDLLGSWYQGMVKPFVVDGKVTSEHANQSIPGLTFRLLTAEPSVLVYDEDTHAPVGTEFHNLTDIGAGGARWVIRGFQAAFVLSVAVFCWAPFTGPGGARRGVRLAAEYGLVVLGMLLFSERTWKHHAVTLVVPLAVLATVLSARRFGPGPRAFAAAVLALTALLTIVPSTLVEKAQDLALTYGTHTAAFLVLAVAMCGVMVIAKADATPADWYDDGPPDAESAN